MNSTRSFVVSTQTRPYSQNELTDARQDTYRMYHLAPFTAYHDTCNHVYLTKKGGHKEILYKENKVSNSGNCSVCWRLSRSEPNVREMVDDYCYFLNGVDQESRFTFDQIFNLERGFYAWLYGSTNERRPYRK